MSVATIILNISSLFRVPAAPDEKLESVILMAEIARKFAIELLTMIFALSRLLHSEFLESRECLNKCR